MADKNQSALAALLTSGARDSSIAAWRTLPARPAEFHPFPPDLHARLIDALAARGIRLLYSHQSLSFERVRAGENVVVVTGTASGKTLCYNLPVLDRLLRDPQARALYLFPTKALAQDQVAGLQSLIDVPVSAYDGDTPQDRRSAIRGRARIVVSNPDMLHSGILPHHTLWSAFLAHLEFVVIDEMHAYRGVFGSHVANVIRRLRRVCEFYGAHPQFILTSATIGNPAELAEQLIEAPVTPVERDGSARGTRHFVIYNPPIVNRALGVRKSAAQESVRITQDLLAHDVQTIVFTRARQTVEQILKHLLPEDASVQGAGPATASAIRGYRGGYLPRQRREIERGLREGLVRAVVATSALELGIDIGGMGAAVIVGYPGAIASTWQEAGRAGRTTASSMAVLVASSDPMDQFIARHPDYFFDRPPEQALINADNLLILLAHLRCAAFEKPFRAGERFGRVPAERVQEFLQFLQEAGVVHQDGGRYFWMADRYPAESVSLRSASADRVALQAGGTVIGEVDRDSAYWMVHPEAVYLHEGQSFIVQDLDLKQGIAHLVATDAGFFTQPRSETTVQLLVVLGECPAHGTTKSHGEVAVTRQVTGYKRISWFTYENLGEGVVSLPPTELHTTGYWLALNEETVQALRDEGRWTNDPNDYGPNWPLVRDRVRARDGYHCTNCGAPENGRQHHVHHKIPFRTFASYREANRLENLVTLCANCHRQVEMGVQMRSGLAGLAYVLRSLAPLSLMCDSSDIGVHSDPQSPLARGRPAVVVYDSVPGGIGFSERLYDLHDELMARALALVRECECEEGCPSCVGPAGENGYGGKRETRALLEKLVS